MRHRHKREPVTKRRKQFALQLIIAARPVNEQRTRISHQLRAVMAARLPSVATDEIEVGAMPRKRPAVVQRPHHLAVRTLQPAEQHFIVEIIAMHIVQMHHIWLQCIQPPHQPLSCAF